MLRFRSLASGSSGNATLVEAFDGLHHTRVLIDCGLGGRQLDERLARAGVSPSELDGIFITHEHGDHVGCAVKVAARFGIPLCLSAGTLAALSLTALPPLTLHLASDGQTLEIRGLQITPFTVPHDAREPLQLRCSDGDRVLGILTDAGHVTPHALENLAGAHALMLESNHDSELLAGSSYPPFLKRRVAGSHGHLSNVQAAAALAALHHGALRTVVGAHLSERNNRPALARAALAGALACGIDDILLTSRAGIDWLTV
ncbi:MBL fold metallo-hydrolase [Ottowia sp.]|uniref:MBL fold metallo-hydrolase n=1 Tax=Ottowia sp. TaxID=1898956 RepID=UPI002BC220A2|nr:MBL fold metallo-hydrolase [Ottowia sp.]HRN74616.1 MBL fold metallo-hydrolase [Ottowia sp.]HRQ01447.1 MBL fold metallo-hydrolase [Ottowia sp.]